MKQYTTNLQKNKNSLPLSPEVVAFQNILPLNKGWSRQYPKQAAPRDGEPFTEPPSSTPETLPFHLKAKCQPWPPKAWEDIGKKTPDHSILVFVRRKRG